MIRLLAVALSLTLWLAGQVTAQEADSERPAPDFLAPVVVEGEELFLVRGWSALPAQERAERIETRIVAVAEASDKTTVDVEVQDNEFGLEIDVDGRTVTITTQADADFEQIELDVLASLQAEAIAEAILSYRKERTEAARVGSAIAALAWTVVFFLITFGFFKYRKRLVTYVSGEIESRFQKVDEATKSFVKGQAIAAIAGYVLSFVLWVGYLILFYYYLSFVLLAFAETRPFAELLLNYVSDPLFDIATGFIGYLPNLITLVIIAAVTKFALRGIRLFFDNIESGVFQISDFERHWVAPTHFLVRILTIVIALIFAYPYIPGSDSRAFQGLTILAGVMLSLGSNTVISNMMSGLFVIYRRSTNVGDRIRVGDKVGDVVEIKLMETLIKSIKNELISIPNAQLLNSEVVNYSRKVDGRGLLVHTTVGIGYEEPPSKVKAMLIEAARRTDGLKGSPQPFVLWTQLGDYAISYEINAFSSRGASLPQIKSDLHENIVEIFNANGTQIMTPSYIADPDVPKIPDTSWDGQLVLPDGEGGVIGKTSSG